MAIQIIQRATGIFQDGKELESASYIVFYNVDRGIAHIEWKETEEQFLERVTAMGTVQQALTNHNGEVTRAIVNVEGI